MGEDIDMTYEIRTQVICRGFEQSKEIGYILYEEWEQKLLEKYKETVEQG